MTLVLDRVLDLADFRTDTQAVEGTWWQCEVKPAFSTSPSTSRDDSDCYFAPSVDGASGTEATYTLDAKLQFRKALVAPAFGPDTSYRPGIIFVPWADLKSSSNPKEDGNSVTFQLPLEVLTIVTQPALRKIIPAVISRLAFVTEADKKFHDINALFSESEYLVLHGFGNDALRFVPEPVVGFEMACSEAHLACV